MNSSTHPTDNITTDNHKRPRPTSSPTQDLHDLDHRQSRRVRTGAATPVTYMGPNRNGYGVESAVRGVLNPVPKPMTQRSRAQAKGKGKARRVVGRSSGGQRGGEADGWYGEDGERGEDEMDVDEEVEDEHEDEDEEEQENGHATIRPRGHRGSSPSPLDLETGWPKDFRSPKAQRHRFYYGPNAAERCELQTDWELMHLEPEHKALKEVERKALEKPEFHDPMRYQRTFEDLRKRYDIG